MNASPAGMEPVLPEAADTPAEATRESIPVVEIAEPHLTATLAGLQAEATPENASAREPYDALLEKLTAQTLRRKMLFLTGARAGEGATTTAANLAGALSRRAASVLLVELHFTAPRLLHLLGDPEDVPGFEDGLRGIFPVRDCIFSLPGAPLSMIASSAAMSREEALHKSAPLNDFLEWAEDHFEWVVLDCPAVLSADWTRWFDLNADPVVLVVRSGATRARGLQKVVRHLQDRLAGVILNDTPAE